MNTLYLCVGDIEIASYLIDWECVSVSVYYVESFPDVRWHIPPLPPNHSSTINHLHPSAHLHLDQNSMGEDEGACDVAPWGT